LIEEHGIIYNEKLEEVMLQICINFCVDYAGPEAERVVRDYPEDFGASPKEGIILKAGDHNLPRFGYHLLTTRDVEIPALKAYA
jgi:hypothetical protein